MKIRTASNCRKLCKKKEGKMTSLCSITNVPKMLEDSLSSKLVNRVEKYVEFENEAGLKHRIIAKMWRFVNEVYSEKKRSAHGNCSVIAISVEVSGHYFDDGLRTLRRKSRNDNKNKCIFPKSLHYQLQLTAYHFIFEMHFKAILRV